MMIPTRDCGLLKSATSSVDVLQILVGKSINSGRSLPMEPLPESPLTIDSDPVGDPNGPVWCVVANVVLERSYGPGGAESRRGTKHFAPGAKVYVFHFFWGMGGEHVTVVARHRKSKWYITITMQSVHLANWRAELVYSPHVIEQILKYGEFANLPRGTEKSRSRAEQIASSDINGGTDSTVRYSTAK
jgi:hypothetical protein